jgi:hypothetical protein
LTVGRLGHSDKVIKDLIAYITNDAIKSGELVLTKIMAGASDVTSFRHRRPISTVDLPPKLMAELKRDAELFFSSQGKRDG